MIPIVGDFVVVADSGLTTQTNIALLESGNYKYIIGVRIKNETEDVKQWILALHKTYDSFHELGQLPKSHLIIGYSEKRVQKDKYNFISKRIEAFALSSIKFTKS
jgi:1-aminocyclopropane-1-carboxylate deaminase/D-cysteine desulfhydrase-like pyridoxal-dependent ACC family enzyme